jgi:hypothetical protein
MKMKLMLPKTRVIKLYKYFKYDISEFNDYDLIKNLKDVCLKNKKRCKNDKVKHIISGILKAEKLSMKSKDGTITNDTGDHAAGAISNVSKEAIPEKVEVKDKASNKEYRTKKGYTSSLRSFFKNCDPDVWYTKEEIAKETEIDEKTIAAYLSRFSRTGEISKIIAYKKKD